MSVFELVHGVEGDCLIIDDTRVAGPKPWGGGQIVATFTTKEKYVPERTCRMTKERDGLVRGWWRCSECDGVSPAPDKFLFCPYCGRKVIEQ